MSLAWAPDSCAMAEIRDNALLLRRIPYSDTSLVVHIVAEYHGRLSLMARGARRMKSPFRATLEPLYILGLRWRPGRTGMGTLIEAGRGCCLLPESHHMAGLNTLAIASQLFREGDRHGYAELCEAMMLLGKRPADSGRLAAIWYLLGCGGWLGTLDHCWICGGKSDVRQWSHGKLHCAACGQGQSISPGLLRGIHGHMQSPRVYLPQQDMAAWSMIIQDTLQAHGLKPLL